MRLTARSSTSPTSLVLSWPSGAVDVGYAHLFVSEPTSNLMADPVNDPTSVFAGSLVGTYSASVDILGLQYPTPYSLLPTKPYRVWG
jgi:hypothetical protein